MLLVLVLLLLVVSQLVVSQRVVSQRVVSQQVVSQQVVSQRVVSQQVVFHYLVLLVAHQEEVEAHLKELSFVDPRYLLEPLFLQQGPLLQLVDLSCRLQ